jgi:hypothetical protein
MTHKVRLKFGLKVPTVFMKRDLKKWLRMIQSFKKYLRIVLNLEIVVLWKKYKWKLALFCLEF